LLFASRPIGRKRIPLNIEMNLELETKTERLQKLMAELDLGGVLLNAQHNFAWLSAGGSNGVDQSSNGGVASLLVTRDGKRYLLANNIEVGRMLTEEVTDTDFTPVEFPWTDERASPGFVIKRARMLLAGNGALASDLISAGATPLIEAEIVRCRYSLTQGEVERYRSLAIDAAGAMRRAVDRISPGQTEREIAEALRHELAGEGLTSVVTLVAADDRIGRFRHPVPSSNRWARVLLLVTCAKSRGLIASLSRMVCVDLPPAELVHRTESAAYVNARLQAATRVGTTGAQLFAVAEKAYAERGFAREILHHHQGGAAGYRTREWVAHPRSTETVQPNQAFAWNPSITGTKVEETCILIDGEMETITGSVNFPRITHTIDGRDYHSPGILSIG
jgi:Xaa-Pro aminopeptidase